MFTVDRHKLEQAESNASLLANLWPPGFEVGGRRKLAECDEMTLYELYEPGGEQEVVLAPEIERILWRHLFRINDTVDMDSWERTDRDHRVARAIALKRLHQFTVRRDRKGESNGAVQVAQALARSFGEELDRALNSDNVEAAFRRLGDMVRVAANALARAEGKLPDMRSSNSLPAPAALILEAKRWFADLREIPPTETLLLAMHGRGYRYLGKDLAGKWKEVFQKAGLIRWYSS